MTRKTLLIATLGLAAVVFVAAALIVSRPAPQQAIAPVPAGQADSLVRAWSPILGPEDAPVTIVEFFDPACEACRAFHPVIKQIMAEYPEDVRVVLRYTPFHGEGSELAIKVLETARIQDVFLPVLEALLENQQIWAAHGTPAPERIFEIAGAAGLDVERARRDVMMPGVIATLNQDRDDVEAMGISQTPTFFVNGKPLPEFGAAQLVDLVASEVALLQNN